MQPLHRYFNTTFNNRCTCMQLRVAPYLVWGQLGESVQPIPYSFLSAFKLVTCWHLAGIISVKLFPKKEKGQSHTAF